MLHGRPTLEVQRNGPVDLNACEDCSSRVSTVSSIVQDYISESLLILVFFIFLLSPWSVKTRFIIKILESIFSSCVHPNVSCRDHSCCVSSKTVWSLRLTCLMSVSWCILSRYSCRDRKCRPLKKQAKTNGKMTSGTVPLCSTCQFHQKSKNCASSSYFGQFSQTLQHGIKIIKSNKNNKQFIDLTASGWVSSLRSKPSLV